MEEAALLLPVQRVVRGVQVEGDPAGRPVMGLQEQIDEQILDGVGVVADLVVARGLAGPGRAAGVLQPVQRRLAGHRRTVPTPRLQLAGEQRHRRVVAQIVVIDQILIAQRQGEHPLSDQGLKPVLDQLRPPEVAETAGKAVDQADRPVRRPKQQRAGIRGDRPAIEGGFHTATFDGCKGVPIRATVCLHRGLL